MDGLEWSQVGIFRTKVDEKVDKSGWRIKIVANGGYIHPIVGQKWVEDKNSSKWWVYPSNCRTKVGARWSPSFPRQSLARRRARNIVQVHAHALNGSWECYHVVRIGLGAIWGDHGRRRSLHFTTPHSSLKKGWVYPLLSITLFFFSGLAINALNVSSVFSLNNSCFSGVPAWRLM